MRAKLKNPQICAISVDLARKLREKFTDSWEISQNFGVVNLAEPDRQFIGQSVAFLDSLEQASRAAQLDRPVLIVGERGTGKELIAERLHRLSPRWDQPLVVLNCATLPETLIEAELFGHEAGAFTGANRARVGRFEEADGGTLFLDELATLSLSAQERLLRAIEYGDISRIGSSRPIRVDVRVVAATNEHLPGLVDRGGFRADLLDRLSFEVITLPPLREREGDVDVLADFFGRRMASELDWERWPGFSPECQSALADYKWPGNVRELRNVVERAVYRWGDGSVPVAAVNFDPFASPWQPTESMANSTCTQLPAHAPPPKSGGHTAPAANPQMTEVTDLKKELARHERAILEQALKRNRHNQRQTAKSLSLSYDQLRHCLKRHELL